MSDQDISVLISTRKRPAIFESNLRKLYDCASIPTRIKTHVYVDDDDESSILLCNRLKGELPNFSFIVGERPLYLDHVWRELYKEVDTDIFGFLADDAECMTVGWYNKILEEFDKWDDKIILVTGGSNCHIPRRWGHWGFFHQNWVKAVGCFAPERYRIKSNIDSWFNHIARQLGRYIYCDDITFRLSEYYDQVQFDRQKKRENGVIQIFYNAPPDFNEKRLRMKTVFRLKMFIYRHKEMRGW
jgi:hypothetical protein